MVARVCHQPAINSDSHKLLLQFSLLAIYSRASQTQGNPVYQFILRVAKDTSQQAGGGSQVGEAPSSRWACGPPGPSLPESHRPCPSGMMQGLLSSPSSTFMGGGRVQLRTNPLLPGLCSGPAVSLGCLPYLTHYPNEIIIIQKLPD